MNRTTLGPAVRRRPHRLIGVVLIAALFASCASVRDRNPVPEEFYRAAAIPGIPRARFFDDEIPSWMNQELEEILERRAKAGSGYQKPSGCYLAISGGGSNGAFGAGLLNGWTAAGNRPRFDMVTGISTGALIAPFAFLGSEYDFVIEEVYTSIRTSDVLRKKKTIEGLTGDSMTDSAPLRGLIEKYVDEEIRQAIAQEYRNGRDLLVATTNLDAGRSVIWSIAAIAASDSPQALELMHSVMLASASIPGVFPPVYIEVEANGQRFDEMHVDGGTASQVFLYPTSIDWRAYSTALGIDDEQYAYVIRNSHIQPSWAFTGPKLMPIVGRTIDTLIKTQGVGDLYRIFLATQRDGLEFRLAAIPEHFAEESTEPFDPVYMKKLYDLGYERALSGDLWAEAPPGM